MLPFDLVSRVAWHEAGHACAALQLGVPVARVIVMKDNFNHGRAGWCAPEPGTKAPAGTHALVALAGAVAEAFFVTDEPFAEVLRMHRRTDVAYARRVLRQAEGLDLPTYIPETKVLVRRAWPSIR